MYFIYRRCAEVFLKDQGKLFDEPVAETIEEAKEFLEDCFAQVFENISEVRAYLDEEGMDVSGVSDEELADELEVFAISDGRYFVVEA
uniref:glyoxalase n=1 Tax=Lachnospira sp. TaxID=2049031 RepID=UPI003FF03DA8